MSAASDSASLDSLLHAIKTARAIRPDVPLALATLVQVEGSSFRQPGARLLVDAECRLLAGAISGGCLEADVAERAAHVCASGTPEHLTYDLRADLQTIWGFDAACDGIAHILLEPLTDASWLEKAVEVRQGRRGGCTITVVEWGKRAARSTSTGLHFVFDGKELVHHPGAGDLRPLASMYGVAGNTGGTVGAVEEEVLGRVLTELTQAASELAGIAESTRRASPQVFQVAEEQVTLFADYVAPPIALHVIGAGRGAEAFARIATAMGWIATIVDHRPAILEALSVPESVKRRFARPEQAHELIADESTAVALLTHIFEIDRAWLERLRIMPHGYIGVLGSRQRALRLLDAITQQGGTEESRHVVHAPIGLDIGGETPESIALATIAEIHAVLHGRPGGPLRERRSPIHDRTPTPVSTAPRDGNQAVSCRLPE